MALEFISSKSQTAIVKGRKILKRILDYGLLTRLLLPNSVRKVHENFIYMEIRWFYELFNGHAYGICSHGLGCT